MGRLIGPKTWDRIDSRFFELRCSRSCFRGCLGVVCVICVLDVCLVCIGPGMAVDCGSLSEPLSCDFSGIVTEGFTIPKTVF